MQCLKSTFQVNPYRIAKSSLLSLPLALSTFLRIQLLALNHHHKHLYIQQIKCWKLTGHLSSSASTRWVFQAELIQFKISIDVRVDEWLFHGLNCWNRRRVWYMLFVDTWIVYILVELLKLLLWAWHQAKCSMDVSKIEHAFHWNGVQLSQRFKKEKIWNDLKIEGLSGQPIEESFH